MIASTRQSFLMQNSMRPLHARTFTSPRFGDITVGMPPEKAADAGAVAQDATEKALPETKKPEAKKKTVGQQIKGTLRKGLMYVALGWASLWGGSMGYDAVIGDGPKPTMNNIAVQYKQQAQTNTTRNLLNEMSANLRDGKPEVPRERIWQEMQPMMDMLKALSPEVHAWAQQMYASGQMKFNQGPISESPNICTFDVISRELKINKVFFLSSDGEKASIMVHEYWHSRQNFGKHIARVLSPKTLFAPYIEMGAKWVGRPYADGALIYGSQVEDEAHLLEWKATRAMGLTSSSAEEYLRDRGICTNPAHQH